MEVEESKTFLGEERLDSSDEEIRKEEEKEMYESTLTL